MSFEIYPSTKALSVYNMLALQRRDMTRAELVSTLCEVYGLVDDAWVAEGVGFLVASGFAVEADGVIAPALGRAPDGRAAPLGRAPADDRRLAWR
jgi:hypothetical protein